MCVGGGIFDPIPSRDVYKTLLFGALNRDRIRVNSMFALVCTPPYEW